MKPRKVSAAAAAALTLALAATACGSDGGGSDDGKKITVGIKFDQPGVGLKTPDGGYQGFDVDVARYVARELGYAPSDVVFKEAKSADRETLLQRGDVDFIAASYSINDERRKKVDFAGPYFLAHQDVLVRAGDDSIKTPADLNDKKLCSVTGSTSAQNVKTKLAPRAQLQEYGGYSECLTGLENGTIDAVTTDDAILAGYAAQDQFKGKFRLGGFKLSDELYGIGVKKGDTELRNRIDAALRKMVQDSEWKKAVEANFGPAGYRSEPPPGLSTPAG
ncbi:glutamate ABC transporter substrate-binding protein [Streptomyces sp. ICN441]|uniref:Glutamate-binding protein n=1 Tax=Streptomyces tirandamycinicus TaxID=2174846 RepID=A0A2S1T2W5_9ACTN|nr:MULTISPECIES: glutamate ABC transporter substrate-binding protein [Streptomyces]AWI32857.1 glutamate-binding protein [Streptomyces tirandamycinicus]NNJ05372.1 glutamate ABC transporter substrate-binding protein [Streptomyces sp. PKU-MA01144]TFE39102.1 glutamate ABC transporter substrate-binding protein [Streptomyces sp. ICN441]